jgi:hypothetical protein
MPFVKLDTDALDSSLWSEPSNTIKVFLTMLLMADPEGHVRSTAPGIASRARIALQPVRDALATLEAPDPDDRTLRGRLQHHQLPRLQEQGSHGGRA